MSNRIIHNNRNHCCYTDFRLNFGWKVPSRVPAKRSVFELSG